MKLSCGFITSRLNCELGWFLDSLRKQLQPDDEVEVIVVSDQVDWKFVRLMIAGVALGFVRTKPNNFSGRHRVTKEDWWSKSSSINTFLCYANHDYVVMVDDRSVIGPDWMKAVRRAEGERYVLAGSYQKRTAMTVENGLIRNGGIIVAEDPRKSSTDGPIPCGGEWFYGCCTGAPLEWWLEINGAPERCDGMSFEDVISGLLMQNNGFPMYYDKRALLIEDRTPDLIGPAIRRSSKELYPNDTSDKAHTLLAQVRGGQKQSLNGYDLRELRLRIRAGEKFPLPDPNEVDWFDGKPLSEFK